MAGIRINSAKNFAGQLYATQVWVNEQINPFLKSFAALSGNKVVFTKGDNTTVELDLSTLVQAGNGVEVASNVVTMKIDGASESYLTVGAGGVKLSGIDTAIATANSTLQTTLQGFLWKAEGETAFTAENTVRGAIEAIWTYVGKTDAAGLSKRIADAEAAIETLTTEAVNVSGSNAIEVTGEGAAKTIALKLDGTDKILSQSADGLKATIQLKAITEGLGENISKEYALVGADGSTELGARIQIEKDRFLKSATYSEDTHKISFVFNLADGTESTTEVDLSGLVDVYTASNGISKVGSNFQGIVDPNSESFLTVGADGFKLAGVQDAIDTAAAAAVEPVKTAVETAVQMIATTITVPISTTGVWTSDPIPGRVMHVSDANGVVYPDIKYSDNTMNCTTTLSADFGETALEAEETWYVVYAKPITVA